MPYKRVAGRKDYLSTPFRAAGGGGGGGGGPHGKSIEEKKIPGCHIKEWQDGRTI